MKILRAFIPGLIILLLIAMLIAGCSAAPSESEPPSESAPPGETEATSVSEAPGESAAPTQAPHVPSFEEIDAEIARAISGAIAYNVPESMLLDETRTIQLLVSPSSPSIELGEQVTEPGNVITATVSITPRMKAELRSANPDAFNIQALHDDPEQLLSSAEPTEWRWNIQAKEDGQQELTLTLYRLVEFAEKEYWRQVSYENTVAVNVTLAQRLARFDWKWLVGLVLTGMLIPAAWRFIDRRQKREHNSSDIEIP